MQNDNQKLDAVIPSFNNDIQRFNEQFGMYDKQLEFAKQVKGLNLEELKVLNQSNTHVNNTILDFIKKYEDIQRMQSLTQGGYSDNMSLRQKLGG